MSPSVGANVSSTNLVSVYLTYVQPGGIQIIHEVVLKYIDNISCGLLAAVCVVTNMLNILVFYKQGLNDSVNISLMTLVVWDTMKGLCGVIMRSNVPFWLHDPALAITWDSIMISKVAYFQTLSNYVSYPIAAYISVERALCVSIPLHVKHIITPKLTSCLMLAISCLVSAMFLVVFFIYDVVYVFNRKLNATVAVFTHSQFYQTHGSAVMKYYNLTGIVNPVLSLAIMTVSTITITYNLKNSSKFRLRESRSTDKKNTSHLSTRNKKVIKMLLVVIAIFIVALVPRIAHQFAKLVEPEYYVVRRYSNIFAICVVCVYIFDFLNACTNFFVFLAMSSAFRAAFLQIFPVCKGVSTSSHQMALPKLGT